MGNLTREQWRERLLKAQIAEDVVEVLMKELSDDDLLRLKDMTESAEEEFVAALKESITAPAEDETPDPEAETDTPAPEVTKDSEVAADGDMLKVIEALGNYTVARVEAVIKDKLTVDMPDMDSIKEAIVALSNQMSEVMSQVSGVKDILDEVLKDDTTRLKDLASNLSPAQRTRMRVALDEGSTFERVLKSLEDRNAASPVPGLEDMEGATIERGVIRDADGKTYATMSEFFHGIVKR